MQRDFCEISVVKNLHHQRLVKKTKVAVKLSSDVTSRNKCFWNLHLKPFSGRKQVEVNRCLVGNLKEVRSASLPFRKASTLGIGWGEYWPWNGILFRQEGWSFPPIPPWKWTNVPLKKGTISRGQFIFQPSILKGHVSFRRSNAKSITPHIKGFVDVFWLFFAWNSTRMPIEKIRKFFRSAIWSGRSPPQTELDLDLPVLVIPDTPGHEILGRDPDGKS